MAEQPYEPTRTIAGPLSVEQFDYILDLVEKGEVVVVEPPGVVFAPPNVWERLKRGSGRSD